MFGSGHYVRIDTDYSHYKWTCSCGRFGAGGRTHMDTWRRSQRHIPKKKK